MMEFVLENPLHSSAFLSSLLPTELSPSYFNGFLPFPAELSPSYLFPTVSCPSMPHPRFHQTISNRFLSVHDVHARFPSRSRGEAT